MFPNTEYSKSDLKGIYLNKYVCCGWALNNNIIKQNCELQIVVLMVSPMEEFWPILPGPQKENYTKLYRGYKRLINTISEKLRKGDVLSLAYQHDLPVWYSEVGPMHEPGYALRVLGQMEGMEIFSPTNLDDLIQGLDTIGRVDLGNMVRAFESESCDTYIYIYTHTHIYI